MFTQISRFSLTTILAMINILCIGLTLNITQWLGNKTINVIDEANVQFYLIFLVFVGIFAMLLVFAGK